MILSSSATIKTAKGDVIDVETGSHQGEGRVTFHSLKHQFTAALILTEDELETLSRMFVRCYNDC